MGFGEKRGGDDADVRQTGPKWRNLYCKGEEEMENLKKEIGEVNMPEQDPVYGENGPLVRIWKGGRNE
jgi:uncharacterized protein YjlB